MIRTAYRIVSLGLLVALLGLLGLVLASPLYVSAPAPPPQTDCKVWNVQLGPIVFAFPYTDRPLKAPMVRVTGAPDESSLLRDHARCDDAPLKVTFINFSTESRLVRGGALPMTLRMSPALPPDDVRLNSVFNKVDPARVTTWCRDGFDTGINQRPSPIPVFGCRKNSGRLLVWSCAFTDSPHDICRVAESVGPATIFYSWSRDRVSHDKAPQLDDSIIDYLNSMIVGGEKLPH